MVKARKRKNSASMRRASRVYLTQANVGKVAALRAFLLLYVTSDGQEIGAELRDQIVGVDKRSKRAYRQIKTELFRRLKQLKLDGVKTIVLEDLRYIKHGKRGTFSRQVNRLLSFWSLTRARDWMRCRCEENGVRMIFVSPYSNYTTSNLIPNSVNCAPPQFKFIEQGGLWKTLTRSVVARLCQRRRPQSSLPPRAQTEFWERTIAFVSELLVAADWRRARIFLR